jgi:hypothetical protein
VSFDWDWLFPRKCVLFALLAFRIKSDVLVFNF